jgi:hypothetical protein
MFRVKYKDPDKFGLEFEVFHVKDDTERIGGHLHFLIFDREWKYVSAKDFIPQNELHLHKNEPIQVQNVKGIF